MLYTALQYSKFEIPIYACVLPTTPLPVKWLIIRGYGNTAERARERGRTRRGARERGCVSKSSETVFLTLERDDDAPENAV